MATTLSLEVEYRVARAERATPAFLVTSANASVVTITIVKIVRNVSTEDLSKEEP